MPNIIMKTMNSKGDIVENEVSKFWNEKLQRLEEENEKLEEELNRYPENSAGYTQEEIDEMVSIKEDISEHPDYDETLVVRMEELEEKNKEFRMLWISEQEKTMKLKEENEKLNDNNWVIDNHKALRGKVILDEDFYQTHLMDGELIDPDDYKKLKEENDKYQDPTESEKSLLKKTQKGFLGEIAKLKEENATLQ